MLLNEQNGMEEKKLSFYGIQDIRMFLWKYWLFKKFIWAQ